MREKDELIQELRMRIRDMLIISEQHRKILGDEICHRKKLEKEVKDLKLQMLDKVEDMFTQEKQFEYATLFLRALT